MDSNPPTAVDYASAAAYDAKQKAQRLEQRVEHLERHLRIALVAIDELRARLS